MPEQLSFSLVGKPKQLTAARVREALAYNPETGVLTWKVRTGRRVKVGKEAGYAGTNNGRNSYRWVRIDDVLYPAHRLCFLHYYGAWPSGEIDHIDGDGLNNRIANLRAATKTINARNQRKRSTNKSGVTGVSWDRIAAKWLATIRVAGRTIYLGQFLSLAEAAAARKRAERLYGYHENHGRAA
jgi:hypothetical protein